jgi:hypothetical protein
MSKLRVDLEEFFRVQNYLSAIDHTKLKDIEWRSNGVPISVPTEITNQWGFTGLNNSWFGESIFKFNEELKQYEVNFGELKND